MNRSSVLLLAALGCTTTQSAVQTPAPCAEAAVGGCGATTGASNVFLAGTAPPFAFVEVAVLTVDATELGAPMTVPTREELLAALARKAKALGADGVTGVEVEEPMPAGAHRETGDLTSAHFENHGYARGVAIRRVATAAAPAAPAQSDAGS